MIVSGKIVAKNEDIAESDFHKEILGILKSNGYSARIVSKRKANSHSKSKM
jgi:hypothetical protein